MSKAEIYGNCQYLIARVFSAFFGKIIYVKPAQNHNFELVTIIGYVHNLFTQPIFDVIV